jgi:hypothetical protein
MASEKTDDAAVGVTPRVLLAVVGKIIWDSLRHPATASRVVVNANGDVRVEHKGLRSASK